MEKGLQRIVEYFAELEIGTYVTDRHRQVAKWIQENLHNTKHLRNIWQVANGVSGR